MVRVLVLPDGRVLDRGKLNFIGTLKNQATVSFSGTLTIEAAFGSRNASTATFPVEVPAGVSEPISLSGEADPAVGLGDLTARLVLRDGQGKELAQLTTPAPLGASQNVEFSRYEVVPDPLFYSLALPLNLPLARPDGRVFVRVRASTGRLAFDQAALLGIPITQNFNADGLVIGTTYYSDTWDVYFVRPLPVPPLGPPLPSDFALYEKDFYRAGIWSSPLPPRPGWQSVAHTSLWNPPPPPGTGAWEALGHPVYPINQSLIGFLYSNGYQAWLLVFDPQGVRLSNYMGFPVGGALPTPIPYVEPPDAF